MAVSSEPLIVDPEQVTNAPKSHFGGCESDVTCCLPLTYRWQHLALALLVDSLRNCCCPRPFKPVLYVGNGLFREIGNAE